MGRSLTDAYESGKEFLGTVATDVSHSMSRLGLRPDPCFKTLPMPFASTTCVARLGGSRHAVGTESQPTLRLPLASELERPLPNCLAERLVGGDGVEPFGLRLVVVSQEVNQTQGLTLRSHRVQAGPLGAIHTDLVASNPCSKLVSCSCCVKRSKAFRLLSPSGVGCSGLPRTFLNIRAVRRRKVSSRQLTGCPSRQLRKSREN